MNNSVFGINNYASMFTSPVKSYEVSPATNFMYSSITSKIYSDTVARSLQNTVSNYMSPLKDFAKALKPSASGLFGENGKANLNQKTVATTDSTSISGTAKNDAVNSSYKFNVSQLATSQTNKGF